MTDRILRWEAGRASVERALSARELERVSPNRAHADDLLKQARIAAASARTLATSDPVSGVNVAYDGARKALTGILAVEGLRPTAQGGHRVVIDVLGDQLGSTFEPLLKRFDRLRRRRHANEYPNPDSPIATPDDALNAAEVAEAVVEAAERVVGVLPPF